MSTIGVFCGSRMVENAQFETHTRNLGRMMAERGHGLVYGGSGCGYMGIISESVKMYGGKVTAVIPKFFPRSVIESSVELDELILVENLAERKAKMFELCDGFIALPGGIGTLDEATDMLTYTQLGFASKPVVFYNIDGFYDPLKEMLNRMGDIGFITPNTMKTLFFEDSADKVLAHIG